MAERRMFAKTIIDSDAFIDMPVTARLLYYDLAMRADDDGFVNSPKKIMRMIGVSQDDMSLLIMKKFIIPFESGIVVIKHWRIHNYIRKDMHHDTKYKDELSRLTLDENNAYTLENNAVLQTCNEPVTDTVQPCNETGTNLYTQVRLGKDRLELGKDKEKKERKTSFDDAISAYTQNSELRTTILDFIKMRKLIKAPMTDRALKGIFKELDKLGHSDEEKIAILEQSIERSWRGVFAISKPKQQQEQQQEQGDDDGVLDLNKMYEEQWANIDDSIFGGK